VRRLLPLSAAALIVVPNAGAETVAPTAESARLALAPNGTAYVAYVSSGAVWKARRGPEGWTTQRVGSGAGARIAGFAVRASGRAAILLETGREVVLLDEERLRWRRRLVARPASPTVLGGAGLTLDRRGRAVVSYAVRRASRQTFLRLVVLAGTAPPRVTAVTKQGFPESTVAPATAPLLMPNGAIRVVETFAGRGAAALSWRREGARWWGRVLFASALGTPVGPVFAVPGGGTTVHAAWSVAYPPFGETHVLLATQADRVRSFVLHRNAAVTGLALPAEGPEVAATETVDGIHAGHVLGASPVELQGRVLGYAAAADGTRHILLDRGRGLEWFSVPGPLRTRVVLEPGLTGRVEGATGGTVELYSEQAGAPPAPVASAPVATDGTFAFPSTLAPGRLRAVYPDPVSGLPYAALLRGPTVRQNSALLTPVAISSSTNAASASR
jgi:hypothetical protein